MSRRRPSLLPLFRSAQQLKLMGELYVRSGEEISLRELGQATGVAQQTTSREIGRLAEAGLVSVRNIGRTKVARANDASPYFEDLRHLLLKAAGPARVIGDRVKGIDGIQGAFVFGSWARRYEGEAGPPPADVDVIVIGDVDHEEVTEACEAAGREIRLDVNAIVLTRDEWENTDDGFVRQIRRGPLVPIQPGETWPKSR